MQNKTSVSINKYIPGFFYVLILAFFFSPIKSYSASDDLFTDLRGKWGGSGTMTLKAGGKKRLNCSAQYTGTASQLRLIISCKSSTNQINMNAQLSANAGRLLGTWEEKTYRAIGTVSGNAKPGSINFRIGGNVLGTMDVKYTKRRQEIFIKASGVSLDNVKLSLKRR